MENESESELVAGSGLGFPGSGIFRFSGFGFRYFEGFQVLGSGIFRFWVRGYGFWYFQGFWIRLNDVMYILACRNDDMYIIL